MPPLLTLAHQQRIDVSGGTHHVDSSRQVRASRGVAGRRRAPHGSIPGGARGVPSRLSQPWPEPVVLHGWAQLSHGQPLRGKGVAGHGCYHTSTEKAAAAAVRAAVAAAAGRASPLPREEEDVALLLSRSPSPLLDGGGDCCDGQLALATYCAWRVDPTPPVGVGGSAGWPPYPVCSTAVAGPNEGNARRAASATVSYVCRCHTWTPRGWWQQRWARCWRCRHCRRCLLTKPAFPTVVRRCRALRVGLCSHSRLHPALV